MDYYALAVSFMRKMHLMHKGKFQKEMSEGLQGEAFILHYLGGQTGDVTPREISDSMCISSARIAAALNSLENKGYIIREIDKNDRRRIIVKLSVSGAQKAKERTESLLQNTVKMLQFLGDTDAQEYVRLTGKLAEGLTQICDG